MNELASRKVFTTGQVAKLCQVAPRTVSKWFDTGQLEGYRIPGSRDRRVPREALVRFLNENGMPLGDLEISAQANVLLVLHSDDPSEHAEWMQRDDFTVHIAHDPFQAGQLLESRRPDCIVIDCSVGVEQAGTIARHVRAGQPDAVVVGLVDTPEDAQALQNSRFDDIFRKPFDAALLAERIRTLRARAAGP